jgi:hypothetical protein
VNGVHMPSRFVMVQHQRHLTKQRQH